jgi:sortase A
MPGPTDQQPPAIRKRRLRFAAAAALALAGIVLLAEFGVTLAWQDPLTYLRARASQRRLSRELSALEHRRASQTERAILRHLHVARRRHAYLAARLARTTAPGAPLGRIWIPRLRARFVFVAGTAEYDLKLGPGHYDDTVLPGRHGTVGIAGHRTTYLAPFRHIDELRPGDRIVLAMPYGRFTYRVTRHAIVAAGATWVLNATRHDQLVLTACHPLYSAAQRYVVFARPVLARASAIARHSR